MTPPVTGSDPRSLSHDDVRHAVATGILTEAQAVRLMAFAQTRAGHRASVSDREEPFDLFKGFNEIFIVVGLVVLYTGWLGVTPLSSLPFAGSADLVALVFALATLGILALSARYFTLRRRMVAPSITLTVMFALTALQAGDALAARFDAALTSRVSLALILATLSVLGWYIVFRIPFAVALVALGSYAAIGTVFVLQGSALPQWNDIFVLSADGVFAWITIGLGILALIGAMLFDLGDPYRVSRRAQSGFWLHVVAAPAIVNTVALTLLDADALWATALLLVFLALMALFAIVVDRRSFLVSGVGYVVFLATTLLTGRAALVILVLGIGMVALGALWQPLRARTLRALPPFPGKERLPPYAVSSD